MSSSYINFSCMWINFNTLVILYSVVAINHMHLTDVVRLKGTKYNIRTVICWTLQRSPTPFHCLKTRGAVAPPAPLVPSYGPASIAISRTFCIALPNKHNLDYNVKQQSLRFAIASTRQMTSHGLLNSLT